MLLLLLPPRALTPAPAARYILMYVREKVRVRELRDARARKIQALYRGHTQRARARAIVLGKARAAALGAYTGARRAKLELMDMGDRGGNVRAKYVECYYCCCCCFAGVAAAAATAVLLY